MKYDRPFINDTVGQAAHPMTDAQYAEYLNMQEEIKRFQGALPDSVLPPEERLKKLEQDNKELKAMIAKLSGEVTANG